MLRVRSLDIFDFELHASIPPTQPLLSFVSFVVVFFLSLSYLWFKVALACTSFSCIREKKGLSIVQTLLYSIKHRLIMIWTNQSPRNYQRVVKAREKKNVRCMKIYDVCTMSFFDVVDNMLPHHRSHRWIHATVVHCIRCLFFALFLLLPLSLLCSLLLLASLRFFQPCVEIYYVH